MKFIRKKQDWSEAYASVNLSLAKLGKPYIDNESDLDLFVISIDLFGRLRKDFLDWCRDFKNKKISSRQIESECCWHENYREAPRKIEQGYIDADKIPSRCVYPTA